MRNKSFFIAISISVVSIFLIFSCGNDDNKWVAKIKGDEITLGKLNSYYYAQQKSIYNDATNADIDKRASNPDEVQKNPTLEKREFLENLVRQRLVYNKAIDDGILKNIELESLIEMAKEAVVVGFYVKEKFKDQVKISDEEIGKVYSDQRARFKGVPVEQAEQYIRQQMTQQKLQVKLRDFVETLKEEGGIKRNLDLLTKKDKKDDSSAKDQKDQKDNTIKKDAPKAEKINEAATKIIKEPAKVEPKK